MNHRSRRVLAPVLLVAAALGLASACSSDTTTSAATSSSTTAAPASSTTVPTTAPTTQVRTVVPGQVDIVDFELLPATVTIAAGESVTFVNEDDVDHDLLSEDGTTLDTGPIAGSQTVAAPFTTPGTYAYYCDIHNAMKGTIIVE